jgi:hypothetical protein
MFKCIFCGYDAPSDTARFCGDCGPHGPAVDWASEDIDQPSGVRQYFLMLSEFYFEAQNSGELEKFSLRIRERLKISHDTHSSVLSKLAKEKRAIEHLTKFRFEFNENVTDAYAGHDTFLSFQYTNLSEDDLFKVSLLWDDPNTTDRIDLKVETKSFVKPMASVTIGASVVFDRIGIKELSDLQIMISDQLGESANFRVEPFSFMVCNHDQRITQNISTHNQISIEGRGVVDASGMGADKNLKLPTPNNQPRWKGLNFNYVPTAKKPQEHVPLAEVKIETLQLIQQQKLRYPKIIETNRIQTKVNFDHSISDILVDAFNFVGLHGVIYIEDSNSFKYELEIVEGMQFNCGYLSPFFINNIENKNVIYDNPKILLLDFKLISGRDLLPFEELFENIVSSECPLLILAEEINGIALEILSSKVQRGILKTVAVNAPDSGIRRKKIIQDIAILTGSTVVEYAHQKIELHDLGRARRVEVTSRSTSIIDGSGTYSAISDWVTSIRSEIDLVRTESELEFHRERIAKLAGGIAYIKISAPTENEQNEKKIYLKNCINSTRQAIINGEIKTEDELRRFINEILF